MGNTNSLQNVGVENVDAYYHSLQPLRRNEVKTNNHQSCSNVLDRSERNARDDGSPAHIPPPSHYKVLPELKGNRYLRSTANGQILHAGGTIRGHIGRNHNMTHVPGPPPHQMQRSRTFIDDFRPNGSETIVKNQNANNNASPLLRRAKTALDLKLNKEEGYMKAFCMSGGGGDGGGGDNSQTSSSSKLTKQLEKSSASILHESKTASTAATEIGTKKCTRLKFAKKRKAPPAPVANLTEPVRNSTPISGSIQPIPQKPSPSQTKTFIKRNSNDNNKHLNATTTSKIPQLKRTFYFGMRAEDNARQELNMKNLASSVMEKSEHIGMRTEENLLPVSYIGELKQPLKSTQKHNVQDGDTTFDAGKYMCIDVYDKIDDNGLLVNMRPTLPRRRLEMPKFNPTAAWHALVEERRSTIRNLHEEDIGIQRKKFPKNCFSSLAQPIHKELPIQIRQSMVSVYNSPCIKDANKGNISQKAWTPQQDLDDDDEEEVCDNIESSSDDCVEKDEEDGLLLFGAAKNSNSKRDLEESTLMHMFSLSLPRDAITRDQIATSTSKVENIGFRSLQKPKNIFSLKTDPIGCSDTANGTTFLSDNWMLHKTTHNHKWDGSSIEPMSLTYLIGGKHLMYLPMGMQNSKGNYGNFRGITTKEYIENGNQKDQNVTNKGDNNEKGTQCKRSEPRTTNYNLHSSQLKRNEFKPTPYEDMMTKLKLDDLNKIQKFSFQSPVRVMENKKLAAKLSKDAELRELQRKRELEAMQRVEENFQRKRAAEKVNIRHQLNLMLNNPRCHVETLDLINHCDES